MPHGNAARTLAWSVLLLAVVAYLAARIMPIPAAWQTGLTQSIYACTLALAAVAVLLASLQSHGFEHRFWMRLFMMLAALFAAQLYWTWAAVVTITSGVPPLAIDLLMDLVAMGVFVSLIWTLTEVADGTVLGKVRYFVDVLVAMVILGVLLYALLVQPWLSALGASAPAMIACSVFPVFGIVTAMWTLTNVFGVTPSRWTAWERTAVAGFLLFSAGGLVFPLDYVSSTYGTGGVAVAVNELLWIAGTYIAGVAAVYRLTSSDRRWSIRPMPPVTSRHPVASSIVPPAIDIVGLLVFAAIAVVRVPGDPVRTTVVAAAAVVAALVALRTGMLVIRAGRLRVSAGIDPITGLLNHRGFQENFSRRCQAAALDGGPLAVIAVDLDDFEHVNRVFGYVEGDRMLVAAARVVAASVDRSDVASRLGGDEFGIVLSGADAAWASVVADRLLAGVHDISDPSGAPLRASVGIAAFPGAAPSYIDIPDGADQALRSAKLGGKDRAVVWSPADAGAHDGIDLSQRALAQSYLATLRATAAAVDARLPLRSEHSRNVGSMALRLAAESGLDKEKSRLIETAGLLHDVGKVGIPDAALAGDPSSLSPDMAKRFEEHPAVGATIVASAGLPEIASWVAAHHERWDGRGFPNGLVAEEIPLGARIIAVADGYDSISSRSPHAGMVPSRATVAAALRSGIGTAYDPVIVSQLLSLLDEGDEIL